MAETCIHQPEAKPGTQCNCLPCRTARAKVFQEIIHECVRCAGRCTTDDAGEFACEKGTQDCPLLDLWAAIHTRHCDPAEFGPVQVELVRQGKRQVPTRRPVKRIKEPTPASERVSRPVVGVTENVPKQRRHRSK